jgi:hypothetical protein
VEEGTSAVNFLMLALKGALWISLVVFLVINISKIAIWLENRKNKGDDLWPRASKS